MVPRWCSSSRVSVAKVLHSRRGFGGVSWWLAFYAVSKYYFVVGPLAYFFSDSFGYFQGSLSISPGCAFVFMEEDSPPIECLSVSSVSVVHVPLVS